MENVEKGSREWMLGSKSVADCITSSASEACKCAANTTTAMGAVDPNMGDY